LSNSSRLLKVNLNLDVEKMIPAFIRRKIYKKQETVYPNQKTSLFTKVFNDDNTLKKIASAVKSEGMEASTNYITVLL
jgi:hypothetical protein